MKVITLKENPKASVTKRAFVLFTARTPVTA